ncbi:MAG: helix-turn-helix domain-containing protein [Phycisphaerales bacterium]
MRPALHNFRQLTTVEPVQWVAIIEEVALQWSVQKSDIESASRFRAFVEARDACCALAMQLTRLGFQDVANKLGHGRSHSMVSNAVKRAEKRFRDEPEWAEIYMRCLKRLIRNHWGLDKRPTVLVKPEERKVAG